MEKGMKGKEKTCNHPVTCFWLVRSGSSVSPSMMRSRPSSITTPLQRTPPPLNTQTFLLPGPSASPSLLGKCASVSGIVWRPRCSLCWLLPKLCHFFFSLASKVRDEPLKSDFTIDLKHEVRRALLLRSILCESDDARMSATWFPVCHTPVKPICNKSRSKRKAWKPSNLKCKIVFLCRIVLLQNLKEQ